MFFGSTLFRSLLYTIPYEHKIRFHHGNFFRMPRKCAVALCTSPNSTSNHKFPIEPKLRKTWILACKRTDSFDPDKSRVCSNHFAPEDFLRDLKNELLNLPIRKILKSDSYPTLNLFGGKRTSEVSPREERSTKRQKKELVEIAIRQVK